MATLAFAGSASAGVLAPDATNCSDDPSAQVFRPWLDYANYTLASGGDAERATKDWAFDDARVVDANEPWHVSGAGDSAYAISGGGSLTTPTICVGLENPTIRFFARRTGGSLLSTLAVSVRFKTVAGLTATLPIGVVPGLSTKWSPTLPMTVVANLLPLLPDAKTPVQFRFTPLLGGSWQVDDVYVDPFRIR